MGKHLFLVVICLMALDLRAQSSLWDRPSDTDYVDLGLPSGVMWCAGNASGFCSYYEVVYQFGSQVPSLQDWSELEKSASGYGRAAVTRSRDPTAIPSRYLQRGA